MGIEYTPAEVKSDGHVVLTGPITGTVQLADGTVVDVSAPAVAVSSQEQADEVAHLVGLRYAEEGHPNDPQFTYAPDELPKNKQGIPTSEPAAVKRHLKSRKG